MCAYYPQVLLTSHLAPDEHSLLGQGSQRGVEAGDHQRRGQERLQRRLETDRVRDQGRAQREHQQHNIIVKCDK